MTEPGEVLDQAHHNLAALEATNDGSGRWWLEAWAELLDGPVDDLVAVLVGTDNRARDLRPTSPFAGVLPQTERDLVLAGLRSR